MQGGLRGRLRGLEDKPKNRSPALEKVLLEEGCGRSSQDVDVSSHPTLAMSPPSSGVCDTDATIVSGDSLLHLLCKDCLSHLTIDQVAQHICIVKHHFTFLTTSSIDEVNELEGAVDA